MHMVHTARKGRTSQLAMHMNLRLDQHASKRDAKRLWSTITSSARQPPMNNSQAQTPYSTPTSATVHWYIQALRKPDDRQATIAPCSVFTAKGCRTTHTEKTRQRLLTINSSHVARAFASHGPCNRPRLTTITMPLVRTCFDPWSERELTLSKFFSDANVIELSLS